jgi:hypothetical protein
MVSKPPAFRKDGRAFKWESIIVKKMSNYRERLEILVDF